MKHLAWIMILLGFIGSKPGALPAQEPPAPDKEAQVKAAIEGYLENRNSFRFLRCRYTYTVAQAATLQDALSGTNYVKPVVSRRLLLMDGPKVLQVEDVDPEVFNSALKAQARGGGGQAAISVPFDTGGFLADGPNQLDYSPRLRCASVAPPEAPHLGRSATILQLGNPTPEYRYGPDYQLDLCAAGKLVFWPAGLKEIDGRAAVAVQFGNAKGQRTRYYAFDVQRGFLPLRIVTYEVAKNRVYSTHNLTHARACSRGRWFPERSVQVVFPQGGGALTVQETKVTELDVDNRPRQADLALQLPAGTNIVNPVDMSSFRLKQAENVNATDLPRLLEMCKRATTTPLMDTGVHPPGWPTWLRAGGYVLLAVSSAGLVAYVLRKRKRLRGA